MKRVKPEKLSLKKMNELLQKYSGKRSQEFSNEQFDAYELDNGEIILKHKFVSSAVLYRSTEEYRRVNEQTINMSPIPKPILSDYQDKVTELQGGAEVFLKRLAEKLSLDIDSISNEKYLGTVSTQVNAYLKDHDQDEIYFELVVLIGEQIKNKLNGKWVFKPNDPATEVLEIYIADPKEKLFNPWLALYKKINESDKVYLGSMIKEIIERPAFSVQR